MSRPPLPRPNPPDPLNRTYCCTHLVSVVVDVGLLLVPVVRPGAQLRPALLVSLCDAAQAAA